MNKNVIKYNKLIRDKIPNIIEEAGKKYEADYLDLEEKKEYLGKKLIEEAKEFDESYDIKELADILEVIYEILDIENVELEEIENIRKDKKEKRGGFKEGIRLLKVIE